VVVTNTNVPVVGYSYGWYYAAGNALVLTAIPNQVVGTVNNIATTVVTTTTANRFDFGITNNTSTNQVVNYGYTTL
jgi:poly-gamma-glutamate capsule biosynthesis protein CapA/YwtB (metallophosphatase superfamily)